MDTLERHKPPDTITTISMAKTLYSGSVHIRLPSINTGQSQREESLEAKKHNANRIAERIDRFLESEDIRMDFYVDKDTATLRIKIIQNKSGKVIKEIPAGRILGGPRIIDINI